MSRVEEERVLPLVLIADDEDLMRSYLSRSMNHAGYRTIEASDGEQCLTLYTELHPDIVLLDAMMPVMDGFTCCAHIHTLPEPYHAPVLMITGLDDREYVDRAFAAGASDYVTKPIHLAVLIQRVRRLIQQSRLRQELEVSNQTLENRVQERTEALEDAIEQLQVEIDKRKQAEEVVTQALERERELSDLKTRLITTLSHEFRTPLSSISLSLDIIEQQYLTIDPEKRSKRFMQVRNNIKRITQVLDDALTISKNEASELSFNPTPINLGEFCHTLVKDWELLKNETQQIIFNHNLTQSNCPTSVWLDPQLLQKIFFHLFVNATRFSPDGGEVRLELNCTDASVIFRVSDQGIGVPLAEHSRIFEEFYRASNANTIPGMPGVGLGLAIVKQAIDLHGASISTESPANGGITFVISFPLNTVLRYAEN